MTSEQNFKKGDKVVYNGEHLHISEEIIKDDILTVYDVSQNGDKVWVQHPAVGKVDASELEMDLPYDRRTAFLMRLQSLLREFDAAIEPEYSSYSEAGIVSIIVGSECVVESYDSITDANIMDYVKE